jgi:hypothetical protein
MPLIDEAQFKQIFSVSKDIGNGRLTLQIGAASRRLKRWVGDAAYADALAGSPANQDRSDDLQLAEAYLAMHFVLVSLNTVITPGGLLITSREEGQRPTTYFTPAQTQQQAQIYFDQAEEIVRPYVTSDGTPSAPQISKNKTEVDCG